MKNLKLKNTGTCATGDTGVGATCGIGTCATLDVGSESHNLDFQTKMPDKHNQQFCLEFEEKSVLVKKRG